MCSSVPARGDKEGKEEAVSAERIEKLVGDYPLVIVERDAETRAVTWLACKLCPLYPSPKRKTDYIYVCPSPFGERSILRHMKNDHKTVWPNYSKTDKAGKVKFFTGCTLPPYEVFSQRVEQVKLTIRGGSRPKRPQQGDMRIPSKDHHADSSTPAVRVNKKRERRDAMAKKETKAAKRARKNECEKQTSLLRCVDPVVTQLQKDRRTHLDDPELWVGRRIFQGNNEYIELNAPCGGA